MIKSHCYSGLWAEGAVIENILANKQRFTGTIEAETERRIMQWNLTGLHGATRAEELINVWGAAGIMCAFVDVLGSHDEAPSALNRANVPVVSPAHNILEIHYRSDECCCHCVFAPPIEMTHTFGVSPREAPSFLSYSTPVGVIMTCPCNNFLHQLSANIIKKGSLTGPHAHCHPPTTLRLSSAATLQNLSQWFIIFQADSCITLALVMQTDGLERHTEMTQEERAVAE